MWRVEGDRKKINVLFSAHWLPASPDFRLLGNMNAGFALDDFRQHVDHRCPVPDDQGVGRLVGYDASFR